MTKMALPPLLPAAWAVLPALAAPVSLDAFPDGLPLLQALVSSTAATATAARAARAPLVRNGWPRRGSERGGRGRGGRATVFAPTGHARGRRQAGGCLPGPGLDRHARRAGGQSAEPGENPGRRSAARLPPGCPGPVPGE